MVNKCYGIFNVAFNDFFLTEIPEVSGHHSATSPTKMDRNTGPDTFVSCQDILSTGMNIQHIFSAMPGFY